MVATDVDRLRRALSTADFPADKSDIVDCAERAGADADTVRALRAIPPVSYANLDEVVRSVSLDREVPAAEEAARRRTHTKPGLSQKNKDVPSTSPITDELGENRGS